VKIRAKRLFTIAIAISVITTAAILVLTVNQETIDSFSKMKPEYLFLAIAIQAFTWFIWGLRIKLMGKATGGEISLSDGISTVLPSLFAACITPSNAGGEPVRVYLLNKKGFSVGDATAVVVGERILDLIFFMIAAPISLFLFGGMIENDIMTTVLVGIGFLFIIGFLIILYGMVKPEKVKKVFRRFVKSERTISKINNEIDHFHDGLWGFVRDGKSGLILSFGCTVVLRLSELTVPLLILLGLGVNVKPIWALCIAAQVIVLIIMAMPLTPGSTGVAEVSMLSLYSIFIGSSILGVFVVIFRCMTYYTTLLAGGFAGLKVLKDMGWSNI
jgi:conserved hypothetical protein